MSQNNMYIYLVFLLLKRFFNLIIDLHESSLRVFYFILFFKLIYINYNVVYIYLLIFVQLHVGHLADAFR